MEAEGAVFHDAQEQPAREPATEEIKRIQLNAQASDILFNTLCPKEFNQISHLDNAKEIWDTLMKIHASTSSMKESKLDILTGQLDMFCMKDGEGVTKMYSRLTLLTNEISGLGSSEMTDHFIMKNILRALDKKYDTICTLLQMTLFTLYCK